MTGGEKLFLEQGTKKHKGKVVPKFNNSKYHPWSGLITPTYFGKHYCICIVC